MRSEWRKDYLTLRYVLRQTWWLWGVAGVMILGFILLCRK